MIVEVMGSSTKDGVNRVLYLSCGHEVSVEGNERPDTWDCQQCEQQLKYHQQGLARLMEIQDRLNSVLNMRAETIERIPVDNKEELSGEEMKMVAAFRRFKGTISEPAVFSWPTGPLEAKGEK